MFDHFRGSMPRRRRVAAVLLALAIAASSCSGGGGGGGGGGTGPPQPPAGPINVTIDGSQVFQRIDGMGVNINVNSWNAGALRPALDLLIGSSTAPGAASTFRVIRDPMTWVANEADIPLLHARDGVTLARVYETQAMRDLWSTIAYLNTKGVRGDHVILNFMGWTPTWLGGGGGFGQSSYVTAGKEPALATMVASLVYYARVVKHLDFTLLAPFNEMDNPPCIEGPCMEADQYCDVMHALVEELAFMGIDDLRLVGPDTAFDSKADAYISCMMSDATIAAKVDHLTLHKYSGPSGPRTSYAGHDYWLTETAGFCSDCDNGGTPNQGEWPFATQTVDFLLANLQNGMDLVCYYDGYDSFYHHHNQFGYWGLLAYNTGSGLYTPRKRFYAVAQVNGFVRPGAMRIRETDTVAGLATTLAFWDVTAHAVTVIGRNTSASPETLNVQLTNLPSVFSTASSWVTTSGSLNTSRRSDAAVTNGAFTVAIPGDAVFSLVAK